MNLEIETLRRAEAAMQSAGCEADRLCRLLVDFYRCDFVIAETIPHGFWARLPWDWQSGVESRVEVRRGKPSRVMAGPVAVSLATLRWIGADVAS